MYTMRHPYDYDSEADASAHLHEQLEVNGRVLSIELATVAGRRDIDSPQKPNEDALAVRIDNGVIDLAVFDGASSQQPIPELGEVTGARYASHTLKELFEAEPHPEPLGIVLSGLNRALGKRLNQFPSVDLRNANTLPTATATLVRADFNTGVLDVAHVSDSFAGARYFNGTHELLTNNLHAPFDHGVKSLLGNIAAEQGTTPRAVRSDPRVKQATKDMFQITRNHPDGKGSGVANGDPNMDLYIHTESRPLIRVEMVLMGSDGLVPCNLDERTAIDLRSIMTTAYRQGVRSLIDVVEAQADKDPDLFHLRTKHVDDSSGIVLRIGPQVA